MSTSGVTKECGITLPAVYSRLTQPQRREVRELYVELQDGLCHLCKAPLSGQPPRKILSKPITPRLYPPNFFKYPVHLHHDHDTGLTIGAVHNHCNAVLWEHHGE